MGSKITTRSFSLNHPAILAVTVISILFVTILSGCETNEIIADLSVVGTDDRVGEDEWNNPDDVADRSESHLPSQSDTDNPFTEHGCGNLGLDGDVTVENQYQVYGLAYYNFIEGDLTIGGAPSGEIVSLSPLSALRCIEGDLFINDNWALDHLWGLPVLQYVGGSIRIVDNDNLSTCEAMNYVQMMRDSGWDGPSCVILNESDPCSGNPDFESGCDYR